MLMICSTPENRTELCNAIWWELLCAYVGFLIHVKKSTFEWLLRIADHARKGSISENWEYISLELYN